MNIDSVVLIGNLTHDIGEKDFGYVGNEKGTAKLSFNIAVNDYKKVNGEYTNVVYFFDVVLWGKQAESIKPYLTKGKTLGVSGKLIQDRWEKDGQKFSKVYINADNVQLLGGKGKGDSAEKTSANAQKNDLGFPEDIPTANGGDPVF